VTRTRPRLLAALVVIVIGLAGCGSGEDAASQKWYQAGDGTNVDAGKIAIRNVVVVSDGSGAATVLASFTNPTSDQEQVTGITVGGQPADLSEGPITLPAYGQATTTDGGRRVVATGTDAQPGRLVDVTFTFTTAPEAETSTVVQEPVEVYADYAPPAPAPTPLPGATLTPTETPSPTPL
jgi:hypothetical protein